MTMPGDSKLPSPEEQQDAEWRRLRAANVRRLLMFPAMVAIVLGWILWHAITSAPGNGR
jgi:hypothetical protein